MLFPQHNAQGLRFSQSRIPPTLQTLIDNPISLNGQTPTRIAYVGGAASTAWLDINGENQVTIVGSNLPTYNYETPTVGAQAVDSCPLYYGTNGAHHSPQSDTTLLDIPNGYDVLIEGAGYSRLLAGINEAFATKKTGGVGWELMESSGERFTWRVDDGITEKFVRTDDSKLTELAFFHFIAAWDRGSATGLWLFYNGESDEGGIDASAVGDISNAGKLEIGSGSDRSIFSSMGVAWLSFQCSAGGWLPGATLAADLEALAKERMQMISPIRPRYSYGSGVATTIDRNGAANAVTENGTYSTSWNFPRVNYATDANGKKLYGIAISNAAPVDEITFNCTDWFGDTKGSLRCAFLVNDAPPTTQRTLVYITDGGSAADSILLEITTAGKLSAVIASTEGASATITSAGVVSDNVWHYCQLSWRNGDFFLSVDGSDEVYSELGAAPPNDLDTLNFGHKGGALELGGTIALFDTAAKYYSRMLQGWQ